MNKMMPQKIPIKLRKTIRTLSKIFILRRKHLINIFELHGDYNNIQFNVYNYQEKDKSQLF